MSTPSGTRMTAPCLFRHTLLTRLPFCIRRSVILNFHPHSLHRA